MRFKHLSLDFWHTLAEPNRDYTKFRVLTLSNWYQCSEMVSSQVYKYVKNAEETMAVQTGEVRDRLKLRELLNQAFSDAGCSVQLEGGEFSLMLKELEDGFLRMPPLLHEGVLVHLHRVSCTTPITVSIGSNTNFIIGGAVISQLLPNIFDFKIFSDELRRCKPCPRFYSAVALGAGICNPEIKHTSEILHIGDHEVCDVQGALAAGLSAELVTAERPLVKLLQQLEIDDA